MALSPRPVARAALLLAVFTPVSLLAQPGARGVASAPVAWVVTSESEVARHAFDAAFSDFVAFDSEVALERLEAALAADPGLGAARAIRASLMQELSDHPEFRRAVADASGASAPEAVLALALRESRAGRPVLARTLAGALAAMMPDDPRAAVFHATFLPGNEDVAALRRLATEHPDFGPAYLWLAFRSTPAAHVKLPPDQEREAVDAARAALRLAPRSPASHAVMARLLERIGRNDEALEHVEHAVALGSTPAVVFETAAAVHLQEGRLAEARRALEQALAHARGDGSRLTFRRGLALLHLHEGDVERSTAGLRELAEEAEREGRRPAASTSHRFLAHVHAAAGQRERALHHLAAAWRLNPARATHANWAATVHAWLGDTAEARAALEEYIAAVGPEPTASAQDYIHMMTGQTLLAEGKPEAALEALARSADNPYAQLARWEAYQALGRREEADAERRDLLERTNFNLYSTGTPIARLRIRMR